MRLAHDAGLRSAFIGFESTNRLSLAAAGKRANLDQDYTRAIRNLDAAGVMIKSIPLSFYVVIAVAIVPILILTGFDFGPM